MKASKQILAHAGLLATASAAATKKRDLDTVTGILSNVQASMQSFATTINDFSVNNDVNLLNSASDDLISVLSDGTVTIQGLGELADLGDTSTLAGPIDNLSLDTQSLTQSLINNKAAIEAAGICITIRISMDNVNLGSKSLLDAITGVVPEGIRAEATPLGDGVVGALDTITIEFGEGNCVDSPAAPGGGPPASSSRPGGGAPPGGAPTSSRGGGGGGPTLAPTSVPGGGPTLSGPPGGNPTLTFPGGGAPGGSPGGSSSRPGGGPSSSRTGGPAPTGGPGGSSSGGPRPTSSGGPGGGPPGSSVPGGRPTSTLSGSRGATGAPTGGRPPTVTAGAAHGPIAAPAGILALVFGAFLL